MVQELEFIVEPPDINHLVTEDDTPVDNFGSEKQQRLLTASLYSSRPEEVLIAAANVGVFYRIDQPAIVPDVFLSFGVQVPQNWWEKRNRSYLIWEFGKPPEVAIEIVSNKKGGELTSKLEIYQRTRISYYVVYDPQQQLSEFVLQAFELQGMRYVQLEQAWLEQINLGLTLWDGTFEGREDTWLRWCDEEGNVLQTGDELAQAEKQRTQVAETRAQTAEEQAQTERQRAQTAEERANKLAEQLRALGVDPDTIS